MVHVTSTTPLLELNSLANAYNINSPFGRGYGYPDSNAQLRDLTLKGGPDYNSDIFLDTDKMWSKEKFQEYKEKNLPYLQKNFSLAQCQILGIKKGGFNYPVGDL